MGKGSRIVSFVGRLSLSRRVLYRRFHCTYTHTYSTRTVIWIFKYGFSKAISQAAVLETAALHSSSSKFSKLTLPVHSTLGLAGKLKTMRGKMWTSIQHVHEVLATDGVTLTSDTGLARTVGNVDRTVDGMVSHAVWLEFTSCWDIAAGEAL